MDCACLQAATVHIHCSNLLLLLSRKANTHSIVLPENRRLSWLRTAANARGSYITVAVLTMTKNKYQKCSNQPQWCIQALTLRTWKTESMHSWRYDSSSSFCVTSPPSAGAILLISCRRKIYFKNNYRVQVISCYTKLCWTVLTIYWSVFSQCTVNFPVVSHR